MAAPVFTLVDAAASGLLSAAVKQAILKQSDWAHLQLSTGTQNTTLTAGASIGATQVQTNTTIPSGSYITIGNGAATPEVRLTTGVSGSAGAFIVTFADALVAAYSNGAAVGVGSYVKATTTRGAQMVLDLADATPSTTGMQIGIYRTHDGTTGVDKLTRYVSYRASAGTNLMHATISNSKEMIFISVEGPRGGETGAFSASFGSQMQHLVLADIVPYFGGDTVPAVACVGHISQSFSDQTTFINVSRNQGNNSSWVQGRLLSMQTVIAPQVSTNMNGYNQLFAKGDGNTYLWPYVVVEGQDGLRGRLNQIFFVGFPHVPLVPIAGEGPPTLGETVTYSSNSYRIVAANKGAASSNDNWSPLGAVSNNTSTYMYAPLIAVPIG